MHHGLGIAWFLVVWMSITVLPACSSSEDGALDFDPQPTDDDDDNDDGQAGMGEPCRTNEDCADGWCLSPEMVPEAQASFCSFTCDLNDATTCPAGMCCAEVLNAAACVAESICESRKPRTNHQCLPNGSYDTYGIMCGDGLADCDEVCGFNGYEHLCLPTGECRTLAQGEDGDDPDGDQPDGDESDGDLPDGDEDEDEGEDSNLVDHQCESNGAFDTQGEPCASLADCEAICAGTQAGVRFCIGGTCRAADGNDFTHYCLPDSAQMLMGPPCTADEDCSDICLEAGAPQGTGYLCFHYSCYAESDPTDGDVPDGDLPDGDTEPVNRSWPCRDDRDCQAAQYCNTDTGLCVMRTSYCQPCDDHDECFNATSRCVAGSQGRYCANACQYPLDCPDGFTCTDVAELGARLCLPSATYLNTHCCADEQCASGKLCDPLTRTCRAKCPATACPSGQRCFEERCHSACSTHSDCYPWEACLSGACMDADCRVSSDCPLNYRCNDRFTCIPSCSGDNDCVPWMRCSNGQCADRVGCRGSEQCPPGEVCSVGAGSSTVGACSVPTNGQCDSCSPASSNPCGGAANLTCADVLEENYYCLHRQDCLNDAECPQGFTCEAAPTDGAPLISGTVCSGRCDRYMDDMVCRVGELRCRDNKVEICNNTLTGWTLQRNCASSSLVCAPEPEPHCVADQVCQPGAVVCNGTTVLTCSVTGMGYDETECGLRTYCTLPSGTCRCRAGSYRCNQNRVEQCNGTGTGWAITDNCGASSECVCESDDGLYCSAAQCQSDNLCTAGTRRCSADNDVEVCGPNGDQWYLVQLCQSGCRNGACL